MCTHVSLADPGGKWVRIARLSTQHVASTLHVLIDGPVTRLSIF